MSTNIRVRGMRRLDVLDLQKKHPGASITFDESASSGAEHGELATVAVIAISVAGLQVLAAWLLKNRSGAVIEKLIEIVEPDGTTRTETLRVNVSKSSAPDADVLKGLANLVKVDLSTL